MDAELKQEVIALSNMLDEMDYYQILKVRQNAFTQDIKKAYFNQSRLFHPDKYYNEDSDLLERITKIFKRIAEGYAVLSDTEKRIVYTKAINGPSRNKFLRFSPKMMEMQQSAAAGPVKEDEGQTAMGKKYYQMAKNSMLNKDYNSAKINLQLAAKMEPNNQTFKAKLEEVENLIKLRKQQKV